MFLLRWLGGKILGLLAVAGTVLGLFLGYKWQKHKREEAEARADGLEAKVEHQEKVETVDQETERVNHEIRESLDKADAMLEYFRDGKLLRRDTEGGSS